MRTAVLAAEVIFRLTTKQLNLLSHLAYAFHVIKQKRRNQIGESIELILNGTQVESNGGR